MLNYIRKIIACSLLFTFIFGFGFPVSVQAKDTKALKEDSHKGSKSVKAEPLRVIAIDPVENNNLPVNAVIRVIFNKPIDNMSIKHKGIILRNSSNREIPITYSINNNTLEIIPKVELKYKSKYVLTVPHNAVQGTDKTRLKDNFKLVFTTEDSKPTIISISDIINSVNRGDNYSLPSTVLAKMSDGSLKEVPVIWKPSVVNTSLVGVYKYSGSVEGFNNEVILTLTVVIRPKYVDNTFKLFADSSKAWAEFEFDQSLTTLDIRDFYIYHELTPIIPDNGYVSGRKVVLNFNSNGKRQLIMAQGPKAKLYTKPQTVSASMSGVTIAPIGGLQVWDEQIAPEWTTIDNKYVVVTTNTEAYGASGVSNITPCVVLKFTEELDNSISGLYKDDFVFIQDGRLLNVTNVIVSGQYLIYLFKSDSIPGLDASKRLTVKARPMVDIRDMADSGSQDYNRYVPKTDDLNGRHWGN